MKWQKSLFALDIKSANFAVINTLSRLSCYSNDVEFIVGHLQHSIYIP